MYYVLHLVAMITMLIDHIGFISFSDVLILRAIGRIAFPLYAYSIAEGWYYTSDRQRYIIRLFGIGIAAEAFFDIAKYGDILHDTRIWEMQNVLFSFVISLLYIVWWTWVLEHEDWNNFKKRALCLIGFVSAYLMMVYAHTEYDILALSLVSLNYICIKYESKYLKRWMPSVLYIAVNMIISTSGQELLPWYLWVVALIAPLIIALYKMKKIDIEPGFKKIYTWFYPVHLACLVAPEIIALVLLVWSNMQRYIDAFMAG